jgi:hypothetical protein
MLGMRMLSASTTDAIDPREMTSAEVQADTRAEGNPSQG